MGCTRFFFEQIRRVYENYSGLFLSDRELTKEESAGYQAGYETLENKWKSLLTIVTLAEQKSTLDGLYGFQETVTDFTLQEVYMFLELQEDRQNYFNRRNNILYATPKQ